MEMLFASQSHQNTRPSSGTIADTPFCRSASTSMGPPSRWRREMDTMPPVGTT